MKKWLMVVILLIISLAIVSAFSKDAGLKWLDKNIDWAKANLEELAFAFLALKSNNYNVDEGLTILLQKKDDANNCWSRGNCNTKDTAFAILALNSVNQDVSKSLTWLDSSLTKAQTSGWYIQINTQKNGVCNITYEEGTANVIVNTTYKIQPYDVDFISVENDLKANLDKPLEQINVNCNKVNDPSMIISLIRITNNEKEFSILQQESGSNVKLIINNACYPSFIGGQCNEDSSFYVSWVLKKINKDIKTLPYLEDNADNNKEYAILYWITKNGKYAQRLAEAQDQEAGHWDNNILVTSLAVNSLKINSKYFINVNNATSWLESKQITSGANSGSFGNVLDTAAALYLAFTEQIIPGPTDGAAPICGDNTIELGEECESDLDCSIGQTCNLLRCTCEQNVTKEVTKICVANSLKAGTECSVCNSEGTAYIDDNSECKINEKCQNGICVSAQVEEAECGNDIKESGEECDGTDLDRESCESRGHKSGELKCTSKCRFDTSACEEEKGLGALFWISLIVIIIILGLGGYFAYKKFFKKEKPTQPEFLVKQPKQFKTLPPRKGLKKPGYEESLERELDKSIREAEKLLRK